MKINEESPATSNQSDETDVQALVLKLYVIGEEMLRLVAFSYGVHWVDNYNKEVLHIKFGDLSDEIFRMNPS